MSRRIKLAVAGTLLALTAFAAGLMINSLAVTASASPPQPASDVVSAAAQWEAIEAAPEPANDQDQPIIEVVGPVEVFNNGPVVLGAVAAGTLGIGIGENATEAQGVITKIENNGAKITLNGRRVINLNDQTVVGDANGALKREDLKQGDRLVATGKVEQDRSLTARWALKLAALPTGIQGKISSIDAAANSFKVKSGKDGAEWTVTPAANATIKKDGKDAQLADLKVDDNVLVTGKADKDAKKIEAGHIAVNVMPLHPKIPIPVHPARGSVVSGTVKSVDAANNSLVVTMKGSQGDTDRKITVDKDTKFGGKDVKGLADLKAGDRVLVTGEKQSDDSLKARTLVRGIERSGAGAGDFFLESGFGLVGGGDFFAAAGAGDGGFYLEINGPDGKQFSLGPRFKGQPPVQPAAPPDPDKAQA